MASPTQQRAAQHTQWLLLGEAHRRLEWDRRHLVLCRSTLSSFHNRAFVKVNFYHQKNLHQQQSSSFKSRENGGRLELIRCSVGARSTPTKQPALLHVQGLQCLQFRSTIEKTAFNFTCPLFNETTVCRCYSSGWDIHYSPTNTAEMRCPRN